VSSITSLFSAAAVDGIPGQPRFYEVHDLGTGPLHGTKVPDKDTTKEVGKWLGQVLLRLHCTTCKEQLGPLLGGIVRQTHRRTHIDFPLSRQVEPVAYSAA
jgi:hypothetical protein